MHIGFTTPQHLLYGTYDRWDTSIGESNVAGKKQVVAKIFAGNTSGTGMISQPLPIPESWNFRLFQIDSGAEVDVRTGPRYEVGTVLGEQVAGVDGHYAYGGVAFSTWTIDTSTLPNGVYYVGSTVASTLAWVMVVRNGGAASGNPTSKYLRLAPIYFPERGGWPTNYRTKIIPFTGVRKASSLAVPLLPGDKFTAPLNPYDGINALWTQRLSWTNGTDYDGTAMPTTTPAGGNFNSTIQRYSWDAFAATTPESARRLTVMYPNQYGDSGFGESYDGDVETSGHGGVTPSGMQLANGDWLYLSAIGEIFRIDYKTRRKTTHYGWRARDGAPQIRNASMIADLDQREAFMLSSFEFVGAGPRFGRAWQMCVSATNENIVYVAEPQYHTILEINLSASTGRIIGGTAGQPGYADGAVGIAKFDQPRGVAQISAGVNAGKLVICDEHNSALRMLDPVTGIVTTICRAPKIPTKFYALYPGDGGADFSWDEGINRTRWGAVSVVQPLATAQFCHPVQAGVLSDGKTLVFVCHDTYQLLKVDLDAGTMTLLRNLPDHANRPDALVANWPTLHIDKAAYFGPAYQDAIFTCSWHYNTICVTSPDGVALPFFTSSPSTAGDHPGMHENGYPRALIPGRDGMALNGDGHASLSIIRKRRADDPVIDPAKYTRGEKLYLADGANRAALCTQNGHQGFNYLAQLKTPGELSLLDGAAFKTYLVDTFGCSDLTDAQIDDVRYYATWNSAHGVHRMRVPGYNGYTAIPDPVVPPVVPPVVVPPPAPAPVPMSFDAAIAMARQGVNVRRSSQMVSLTRIDVTATDWIKG